MKSVTYRFSGRERTIRGQTRNSINEVVTNREILEPNASGTSPANLLPQIETNGLNRTDIYAAWAKVSGSYDTVTITRIDP